jgi:hypothetical protein
MVISLISIITSINPIFDGKIPSTDDLPNEHPTGFRLELGHPSPPQQFSRKRKMPKRRIHVDSHFVLAKIPMFISLRCYPLVTSL